jgi:hypothetical protein
MTQVLGILERRAPELEYILVDTPGESESPQPLSQPNHPVSFRGGSASTYITYIVHGACDNSSGGLIHSPNHHTSPRSPTPPPPPQKKQQPPNQPTGQIEVFTWSASGAIITEMLATAFPTTLIYVVDTPRTAAPTTFMSNMLYACSILYKTRLPLVLAFNKSDVLGHGFAREWMEDFDKFQEVRCVCIVLGGVLLGWVGSGWVGWSERRGTMDVVGLRFRDPWSLFCQCSDPSPA